MTEPATLKHLDQIRSVTLSHKNRLIVWLESNRESIEAEQYRLIRTRLMRNSKKLSLLLVSSADEGAGKTLTALNLAGIIALQGDERVLLIDADMRRSSLEEQSGIRARQGLAAVLQGQSPLQQALVQVAQVPNLHILPAGEHDANPAELLSGTAWRDLCAYVRRHYRWVVIDSPPIASVADYELLELASDGIIMVVRPDHTRRRALSNALMVIDRSKLAGAIVNCARNWFGWKMSDYYHHSGTSNKTESEVRHDSFI